MKRKDIKKKLCKVSGFWSLVLKIPYNKLDLDSKDFLSPKDVEDLTGLKLKFGRKVKYIANRYHLLDHKECYNGQPKDVLLSMMYSSAKIESEDKSIYAENNDMYFYTYIIEGHLDNNLSWLRDESGELMKDYSTYTWYDNNEDNARIITLIKKYINNFNLRNFDIYDSENKFKLVDSDIIIQNELIKDLFELENYQCAFDISFSKDFVTFYFNPYGVGSRSTIMKRLKNIIVKHKLKL